MRTLDEGAVACSRQRRCAGAYWDALAVPIPDSVVVDHAADARPLLRTLQAGRRKALKRLATAQSDGVATHQVDLLPLTTVKLRGQCPDAPSMQVDEGVNWETPQRAGASGKAQEARHRSRGRSSRRAGQLFLRERVRA